MLAIAKIVFEDGTEVFLDYSHLALYEDVSNKTGYLLFTYPDVISDPRILLKRERPRDLIGNEGPLSFGPEKGGYMVHVDLPGCLAFWKANYVDYVYPSRIKHFIEFIPFYMENGNHREKLVF